MTAFTPPPAPPGTPPAQQSSSSTGCLKIAAIGCTVLAIIGIVAVVGLAAVAFSLIRSTDVYKTTLNRVASDPRVIAQLGSPIERGWWAAGSVDFKGSEGSANLRFPIHGPKGKGIVHVSATRSNDKWDYTVLRVTTNDTTVDVLSP